MRSRASQVDKQRLVRPSEVLLPPVPCEVQEMQPKPEHSQSLLFPAQTNAQSRSLTSSIILSGCSCIYFLKEGFAQNILRSSPVAGTPTNIPNSPTIRSSLRRVASDTATIGNRSTSSPRPTICSTALTGAGLASQKCACIRRKNRRLTRHTSTQSFSSAP